MIASSGLTLDASVVIAHLNPEDQHHRRATGLLDDYADQRLWISTITLAEVLTGYARANALSTGENDVGALDAEEAGLPPDAASRLATLRAETGLKLPDCCVLLAAEQTGAAVASFDDRLRQEAERRGLAVVPA